MTKERVAVVGIGYVGLPVACMFASSGFRTIGVDIDQSRVDIINSGTSPIRGDEPGLQDLLGTVVENGMFHATSDVVETKGSDLVIVCVDTPLDANGSPYLGRLRSALEGVATCLVQGATVSVESTIPPGTMIGTVIPILEAGSGLMAGDDFHVIHCPERVMVGRLLHNLINYDRVLGGLDDASRIRGAHFYSTFIEGKLLTTSLVAAEIAKTGENAYRDVQIAFANEMALICESLGADVFEVRDLINSCPFRDMHIPGAGVGGHCLPKDSWLLVHNAGEVARLIPAAREVNDSMPHHLASMARQAVIGIDEPRIAIMGLAFLGDSDDVRVSPSYVVIDDLADVELMVHDPFVIEPYRASLTDDLWLAIEGADCAVFVTDHSIYRDLNLDRMASMMRTAIIVDGRNLFRSEDCHEHGIIYRGIGKG